MRKKSSTGPCDGREPDINRESATRKKEHRESAKRKREHRESAKKKKESPESAEKKQKRIECEEQAEKLLYDADKRAYMKECISNL